jgi:hypothetical protein
MRKAAVVFVIGLSVGSGLAAIHLYAQGKLAGTGTVPPRMTPVSEFVKGQQPIPPGMSCARTAFVTMSTNMMMSCPADFPLLNGVMFGEQTKAATVNGPLGRVEWSFYCCRVLPVGK